MADVYVYNFTHNPRTGGDPIPSKRWATLEAIKGLGVAEMQSQLVVDHTEVDGAGFLMRWSDNELHPSDEIWFQIRSLERRASSRDGEALNLSESTDGRRKYILSLESRELRNQAKALRAQRTHLMVRKLAGSENTEDFALPDERMPAQ